LEKVLPKPNPDAKKYYVLSMFPYPSGKLHMGHVRVYSISDTFAHYYRMQGYKVIHPMGWDAFGLPAENAAIENKVSPAEWTVANIAKMKEQLLELGCTFDWDREISTCDPKYYRWTQELFLKLYERGLVYQAESMVNWDPVDQTVLADEQVDGEGRSWRSGALVEKKPLKQWFFRTTAFAESLYHGLDDPSLVNWRDIIQAQRNWLGAPSGTKLEMKVVQGGKATERSVTAWTATPEFLWGAELLVLHPEHFLAQVYGEGCQLEALNPLSGDSIPIVVTAEADFPHGSQSILAMPSAVEEHKNLFEKLGRCVVKDVLGVGLSGEVTLKNSGPLSGLVIEAAKEAVLAQAKKEGWGGFLSSPHLQDWLVSRQRYWGTPIPVVHSESHGVQPLPSSSLPVTLPDLDPNQMHGKGKSPLLQCDSWLSTTCPSSGGPATRETDTMDTFVDSSWYFLRYLDPSNTKEAFSTEAAKEMPVDLYIGGKEHAYLHLYFARFFTHFLHSEGLVSVKEPFSSLITQGMVKSRSYRLKSSTRYLREDEVYQKGEKYFQKETDLPVVSQWEKMSKSKHNGVDPGAMVAEYGCDTVRLMMLSSVGPGSERKWSESESYPGVRNMTIKLWKLVYQAVDLQTRQLPELRYDEEMSEHRLKLQQARDLGMRHANHAYSHTRNLAVVIARVHAMIAAAWAVPGQVKAEAPEYQRIVGDILILLAPIAPHLATELWESFRSVPKQLWEGYNWEETVWQQQWPSLDLNTNLELKVVANGKEVAKLDVAKWYFDIMTEQQAFDLACCEPNVQDKVLPHDLKSQSLTKFDAFEAILEINYETEEEKILTRSPEEHAKWVKEMKEAKKLEKQAKKEAREKRKQEYAANLARREKIAKSSTKQSRKDGES